MLSRNYKQDTDYTNQITVHILNTFVREEMFQKK